MGRFRCALSLTEMDMISGCASRVTVRKGQRSYQGSRETWTACIADANTGVRIYTYEYQDLADDIR